MARLATADFMAATFASVAWSRASAACSWSMATDSDWWAASTRASCMLSRESRAATALWSSESEALSVLILDASAACLARAASRLRRAEDDDSAPAGLAMTSTRNATSAAAGIRESLRIQVRQAGKYPRFGDAEPYRSGRERCKRDAGTGQDAPEPEE